MTARNESASALAQQRRDHAVQLRLLGQTYQQIAEARLPCREHRPKGDADCPLCLPMYANRSGARRAVEQGLREEHAATAEQRETLRSEMLGQIELVVRRQIADAVSGDEGVRGAAARNLVRLWDRKARLLGLDAPTRVQVTTELDAELQMLADAIGADTLASLTDTP